MKNSLVFFIGLLVAFFVLPFSVSAAVLINEFSVNGATDWVELFNTDASSSVNLSTYTIQQGAGAPISLSGTLPKGGLLTFTFTGNKLDDTTGTINLLNNAVGVGSITYGSGVDVPTAPGSGQSAYRTADGGATWAVGTSTEGWFNSSSSIPTQASLATLIANGGAISTNFGTIPDLSRAVNLYF